MFLISLLHKNQNSQCQSHMTLYNTGVAFFHGVTEIDLDSVNPIKGNINGNRRNMDRSKLKKNFMFYCGELSIYI